MPETEVDTVSREWLQGQLRAASDNVIVLDCRSTNEFAEGHIRLAVNFSIPSIMLRRLAAGKIDLTSTIKCRDLKQRIEHAYSDSVFVLYTAESATAAAAGGGGGGGVHQQQQQQVPVQQQQQQADGKSAATGNCGGTNNSAATTMHPTAGIICGGGGGGGGGDATIINVLHRRLKQDGCRVYLLEDGFASFRNAFPEWCEDDCTNANAKATLMGTGPTEQLMGLRSLRISTPHSDSACSSSAESSDCETGGGNHHTSSSTHPPHAEAPVEILPGLFLGNAAHSADARALQRYNIRYVLNVTPDLPNVFAESGAGIEYLQIPITDHWSQDLAGYFPVAIKFIEDARNSGCSVLVHCLAGVSRSVTVTLAYLMHARALCLNDAFSLVRQRKPDVSPNFHFMEQLHSFEGQLLRQNPARTPLSAVSTVSTDSSSGSGSYLTPDCGGSSAAATPDCLMGGGGGHSHNRSMQQQMFGRPSKYSCACLEVECKCMMMTSMQPALATVVRMSSGSAGGGGVGVSPDSGIEFDRWPPAVDGTPK